MKSQQTIGQDVRFDSVPAEITGPGKGSDSAQRPAEGEGSDRRMSVLDRRSGAERRVQTCAESGYSGSDRRTAERRVDTGLERRRGPGRRLSDDRRAAEEGEMTAQQFEFVMAIEAYKKVNKRMYPTWTEVLEVIQQLGYRKVASRAINLENCPEPELVKVA
jgi:hypothetical protein